MIRKLLRFLALPNRGTLTPEQRAERNKGNWLAVVMSVVVLLLLYLAFGPWW